MGKRFSELSAEHQAFIARQPIFFVATALPEGRINLSPKGYDSLRVLGPDRLVWLNLTGSGNETAVHLEGDGRITLMWCAFEGPPLILRVYGRGRARPVDDPAAAELVALFPDQPGRRRVVEVTVELVQSSCGLAVPERELKGERPTLRKWAEAKGDAGVRAYWREKNAVSLDGLPTGLAD